MRVLLIIHNIFLLCDSVHTRFMIGNNSFFISHQSLLYHMIPILITTKFVCIVYQSLLKIFICLKFCRLTPQWDGSYWSEFVKIIWAYTCISKRDLIRNFIWILVKVLMKLINELFLGLHLYFYPNVNILK